MVQGLDPDDVYNMYIRIPSIAAKDAFVVELTRTVFEPGFVTTGTANIQRFLRDLVGFYVIMEGIFFYAGFAMMLALKRQNKMVGIGEQFEYIMRDESLHLAFGCDLINTIRAENPGCGRRGQGRIASWSSARWSSNRPMPTKTAGRRHRLNARSSPPTSSTSPTGARAVGLPSATSRRTPSPGCRRPTISKEKNFSRPGSTNTRQAPAGMG